MLIRNMVILMFVSFLTASPVLAELKLATPSPEQAAWHDLEMGAMICFGLETWQDKESDDETSMENLKLFNPPNVNTDQ